MLKLCNWLYRVDQILHPSDIVEMKDKIDANNSSELHKQCNWGRYARGAVYALQSKGNHLVQVRDYFKKALTFSFYQRNCKTSQQNTFTITYEFIYCIKKKITILFSFQKRANGPGF